MRIERAIAAALLAAMTISCTQQPQLPPDVKSACEFAAEVIDQDLKEYAAIGQSGVTDDSAIREGNRLVRQQMALTEVQIQYAHMRALGCPVAPSMNLSRHTYYLAAVKCSTEELRAALKQPDDRAGQCNQEKWIAGFQVPTAASQAVPASSPSSSKNR